MSQFMPNKRVAMLNEEYDESDAMDRPIFADYRANILMWTGQHYDLSNIRVNENRRETRIANREQRIRLTFNVAQKIVKQLRNGIVESCANVTFSPYDELDPSCMQAARTSHSAWRHISEQIGFRKLRYKMANDYSVIGETHAKVGFNYDIGKIIGWKVAKNSDGETVRRPVRTGGFEVERIHAFDLLRDKSARSFEEARFVIYRKLVDTKDLKRAYPDANFEDSSDGDIFKVFDGANGEYTQVKGKTLVREHYYRPCERYPNGYFFFATEKEILDEGELPLGVFPIVSVGWDEIPTSPRHNGIMTVLRPLQIEVNRAASKIAEHQITLGDDRVLAYEGTKISPATLLPGIRLISYRGTQPQIMSGSVGEKYLPYLSQVISLMHDLSGVGLDNQEKPTSSLDSFAMLFKTIEQREKNVYYNLKFSMFIEELAETLLEMARQYYGDEELVSGVGLTQQHEIQAFRSSGKSSYKVKIDPMPDDLESKYGKILFITQMLQYAGAQMGPELIGKLASNIPYGNFSEIFSDQVVDYRNLQSDISAMENGYQVPVNIYDNHLYYVNGLVSRIKKRDFHSLPLQVRQSFLQKIQTHEEFIRKQKEELVKEQQGMIPASGGLITVNLSTDENGKIERIKIPHDAIVDLYMKLKKQGAYLGAVSQLPPEVQAEIGGQSQPAAAQPNNQDLAAMLSQLAA